MAQVHLGNHTPPLENNSFTHARKMNIFITDLITLLKKSFLNWKLLSLCSAQENYLLMVGSGIWVLPKVIIQYNNNSASNKYHNPICSRSFMVSPNHTRHPHSTQKLPPVPNLQDLSVKQCHFLSQIYQPHTLSLVPLLPECRDLYREVFFSSLRI